MVCSLPVRTQSARISAVRVRLSWLRAARSRLRDLGACTPGLPEARDLAVVATVDVTRRTHPSRYTSALLVDGYQGVTVPIGPRIGMDRGLRCRDHGAGGRRNAPSPQSATVLGGYASSLHLLQPHDVFPSAVLPATEVGRRSRRL